MVELYKNKQIRYIYSVEDKQVRFLPP